MVVLHQKSLYWSFFGLWDSLFESNLVPWASVVCRCFYNRFSFQLLGGGLQGWMIAPVLLVLAQTIYFINIYHNKKNIYVHSSGLRLHWFRSNHSHPDSIEERFHSTGCHKKRAAGCIFNLRDGIHSFVWSTKTFLYHTREPRYKQNNMGYQILRIWNKISKSDTTLAYPNFL